MQLSSAKQNSKRPTASPLSKPAADGKRWIGQLYASGHRPQSSTRKNNNDDEQEVKTQQQSKKSISKLAMVLLDCPSTAPLAGPCSGPTQPNVRKIRLVRWTTLPCKRIAALVQVPPPDLPTGGMPKSFSFFTTTCPTRTALIPQTRSSGSSLICRVCWLVL